MKTVTVNELIKERMTIRNSDPRRSTCLSMIITEAKNVAKSELREVTQDDIKAAALKCFKACDKVVESIDKGIIDRVKDGLPPFTEDQLKIVNEGKIEPMAEKEIYKDYFDYVDGTAIVKSFIDSLTPEELVISNKNNIMIKSKTIPGMDMKMLSESLKGLLK